MKDRVIQHPNRYRLTEVLGENGVYDLTPVPGTITEVGTPLNKATLLDDVTASIYNLNDDMATVNNALLLASMSANESIIVLNLKDTIDGYILPTGITLSLYNSTNQVINTIQGDGVKETTIITVPAGNYVLKWGSNKIVGYDNSDVTINASVARSIVRQNVFRRPDIDTISQSGIYQVADYIKNADICIIGGGAGSANTGTSYHSGGGGGGYMSNHFGVNLPNEITATIGSGGGYNLNGGATSLVATGIDFSANGGRIGSGYVGGDGGSGGGSANAINQSSGKAGDGGSDGSNGVTVLYAGGTGSGQSTYAFGDSNLTLYCGGGGGGYIGNNTITLEQTKANRGYGGAGGGGDGGWYYTDQDKANGTSANAFGGGGGGKSYKSSGGSGYQGAILFRKHV